MLESGRIGPFAGGALAAIGSGQPNEQAAAGRVGDIADQPVIAFATAVREIMAADRLGIAREAACQLGSLGRHGRQAAARSRIRTSG